MWGDPASRPPPPRTSPKMPCLGSQRQGTERLVMGGKARGTGVGRERPLHVRVRVRVCTRTLPWARTRGIERENSAWGTRLTQPAKARDLP